MLSRSRITILFSCLLFTLAFHWMYVVQLRPVWGYWGFEYANQSWLRPVAGFLLCLLPGFLLPLHVKRPSALINWVMYLTVYVPSVMVPIYVRDEMDGHSIALVGGVVAGFCLQCGIPCLKRMKIRTPQANPKVVWSIIAGVTVLMTGYMLVTRGSSMRLVSFEDVYTMRADIDMSALDSYMKSWLACVLYPLFISYGLFKKKRWPIIAGTCGEVMLYAMVAMKSILLSVPVYFGVYLLLRKDKNRAGMKLAAVACLLVIVSGLTAWLPGPGPLMLGAVIGMRTFGTPGLCTHQYDLFFAHHPWTYFSQVRGVDMLISYPYDYPVYRLIGQYFYDNIDLVANSHPFAQDALAGCGVYGLVPIGILVGIVCWVLDCVAAEHASVFVCLFSVYAAMNFGNASVFTSITTFGIWLTIVLLYFLPKEGRSGRGTGMRQVLA